MSSALESPTLGNLNVLYGKELVDIEIRENHKLKFISGAIAGHHIISFSVIDKLTEKRKKEFIIKGWNLNDGNNVVLLPTVSGIACQYNLPYHSGSHEGKMIFGEFYSKNSLQYNSDKKNNTLNTNNSEIDESNMLNEDKPMIKDLNGYHKVVAMKLAVKLKKINCDTGYILYIKTLNVLSISILKWISTFTLILTNSGHKYKKDNINGCGKCDERKPRKHYGEDVITKSCEFFDVYTKEKYGIENNFKGDNDEDLYITKNRKHIRKKIKTIYKSAPNLKDIDKLYWTGVGIPVRLKLVEEIKNGK